MSIVDAQFILTGDFIPVDHGYLLYSAISEIIPEFHKNPDIGIFPISGNLIGNRQLAINRDSKLTIRLHVEMISTALNLAGKTLEIKDNLIHIGIPKTEALIPTTNLQPSGHNQGIYATRNVYRSGWSSIGCFGY